MELVTLATTALALIGPYFTKTGESIAEKIGEDLWTLIKKPFTPDKEQALIANLASPEGRDSFINELTQKLGADPSYLNEVKAAVEEGNNKLSNNTQQAIYNQAPIGKQVNIGNNSGDLTF